MTQEEPPIFRTDAKRITDLLFDAKLFKEDITRDQMIEVETLICYLMDSRYKGQKRTEELMEKLNGRKFPEA